jgi:hypothetical protein
MPYYYHFAADSQWTPNASIVIDDTETFTFSARNDEVDVNRSTSGKLLNYSGKSVGSFSAFFEKVKAAADEQFPAAVPEGAFVMTWRDGHKSFVYANGRVTDNGKGQLESADQLNCTDEVVSGGNLRFTISREYTSIDLDTYYVIRAVNDIGEEGPPSDISDLVTRKADEKAVLTFDAAENAAAENISAYRLYRASGGTSGSDFLYVDEIAADGDLQFHDDKMNEELNEVMPNFGSVPENLDGIAGMNGFLVGYKGKDIYFSEPYKPYSFPWEYNQSVPFDIVGIAVRGNYLYVMTNGPLFAFVGDTPANILPLSLRFDVPCISRNSIAHVRGAVIYAGTTGLVIIENGSPRVFSDQLYTLEQYKNLHFENCLASGEYDGKYFAVFADKVLLFDFSGESLHHTVLDSSAFTLSSYSWNDGSWLNYRDNFALSNTSYGETMITQDFSAENISGVWQSKEFVYPRPIAFTCARVRFNDPTATVNIKLYAEKQEVFSGTVQHNKAFRLPVLRRECRWSVSVSGSTDITTIELAESMQEM